MRAYAPDFARRVGFILTALLALIARRLIHQPRLAAALCHQLSRIARRLHRLMAGLAAGRMPPISGPHTAGTPHPETIRHGNPIPTAPGWLVRTLGPEAAVCAAQLEDVLAELQARVLLDRVPSVRYLLHPVRRLLGIRPFGPTRRPAAPKPAREPPPLRGPDIRSQGWAGYGACPPLPKPA
jgi:hypothetical protein